MRGLSLGQDPQQHLSRFDTTLLLGPRHHHACLSLPQISSKPLKYAQPKLNPDGGALAPRPLFKARWFMWFWKQWASAQFIWVGWFRASRNLLGAGGTTQPLPVFRFIIYIPSTNTS